MSDAANDENAANEPAAPAEGDGGQADGGQTQSGATVTEVPDPQPAEGGDQGQGPETA